METNKCTKFKRFDELTIEGLPVKDFHHHGTTGEGHYRLYVHVRDDDGFLASAVRFVKSDGVGDGDTLWDGDNLIVDEVFQVFAGKDGIQKIPVGVHNSKLPGCFTYPHIDELIQLLQEVEKLEKEHSIW